MPKKAGYNIRPSVKEPRRTSSERAAWLAKMRRAVAQKEILDPTEADIQEMRTAIGDNGAFAKFSDANKALLFSVTLTLRRKLEVYGELLKFEQERAGPLLKTLMAVVADVDNSHGILGKAADEMSEVKGITVSEAWRKIIEFANMAVFLGESTQRIAAKSKVLDGRTIGSRRKRDETMTFANCLKVFKTVVPGVKADDWHDLEARISCYMSGKEIDPDSLKKRRQRARTN